MFSMSARLVGHKALVSGGARGIGRTIALSLAAEGADVGISYLASSVHAKQVVARVREGGVKGFAVHADVTKEADVRRLVAGTAGIVALTKALAREVGRLGITVNVVSPGIVQDYEMSPKEAKRRVDKETAVGRPGTAKDLANAVAFLCSDEAEFITGDVVNVTGGWLL